MRSRVWRLLGGATDEQGRPASSSDDWQEVFEGAPHDAHELTAALGDAGLEVASRTYVPARFYGWPEPARSIVSVRSVEAERAVSLIEALPHLGNALAPSPSDLGRPRGVASLVELATSAEAATAMTALREAGISAHITEPLANHLDDVGYVISVNYLDLYAAAEIIRRIAEASDPPTFRPRDLAQVEPPHSSTTNTKIPGGVRLRWFGWTFLTLMLGFIAAVFVAFGLVGFKHEGPADLLWALGGSVIAYGAWLAGRRSASLDHETP